MLDTPKTATATEPNYTAIKQRQQTTWAAGDYAMIGTTLQIVGESICESVDLRSGQRIWEQDIGGTETPWVARRPLKPHRFIAPAKPLP